MKLLLNSAHRRLLTFIRTRENNLTSRKSINTPQFSKSTNTRLFGEEKAAMRGLEALNSVISLAHRANSVKKLPIDRYLREAILSGELYHATINPSGTVPNTIRT